MMGNTVAQFVVRDSRAPGHFWADNELLDVYGNRLGPHGIAVYMAMARRANNTTGELSLSERRIAALVHMSAGGVHNALSLVCSLGLARKVLEGDGSHPSVYVLADVKALACSSHEQGCSSGEHLAHPVSKHKGRQDSSQDYNIKTVGQGKCSRHPGSGITIWGTCWDCYSERCKDRGHTTTTPTEENTHA